MELDISTRAALARLAGAAFDNALELSNDSDLLASHGRWARAVALKILACEELGKALYSCFLGTGCMKAKKDSISKLRKSHHIKQVLACFPEIPELDATLERILTDVLRPSDPDPREDLDIDRLRAVLKERSSKIAPSEEELASFRTLADGVRDAWNRVVVDGEIERLKHACLYADLDNGVARILRPADVGADEYAEVAASFDKSRALVQTIIALASPEPFSSAG